MISIILKCSIFATILLMTLSSTNGVEGRNLRSQKCTPKKSKISKRRPYEGKTAAPVIITTPNTEAPKQPEITKGKPYGRKTAAPVIITTPNTEAPKQPEKKKTKVVGGGSTMAQKMLVLVNAERSKLGLKALCLNKKLTSASQKHSEYQARNNKNTHIGSNGSEFDGRIRDENFKLGVSAENVAVGQKTVKDAVEWWMDSPGHKANILSSEYEFFGAGEAQGQYMGRDAPYWTQNFASSDSEKCD